ncbi:MAG: DUF5054 domain-containing protein [Anaerolineae bacterium]|nr:DUF5054 domain-containing protein [Anaerolineae bacterium]
MPRSDIDELHVIFKTHLDVGFTDYAHNVIGRYMTHFIPDAIALARALRLEYPDEPFCWTVGSWLIHEYLRRASPDQIHTMESAIHDGMVTWHALPFTTHTEFMDAELLRYGLSLSQELDRRFGRQTIAGKMTDVPGHTRAMIPLLQEAGIRFFHVGVNPAATVPDVPPVFVWRDEASDSSVIVAYQAVYGDVMLIPGTTAAIALVFTGDNLGPPSIKSVHETYATLRQQFPNARFIGSSLDAVARLLIEADPDLPVVTSEIGDTWIQGVGTDPTKVSQYRELLRLRREWLRDGRIDQTTLDDMHRALIMIPEHTWGMDLKTHLQDYEHYENEALVKARQLPHFMAFERSWDEQRAYIGDALEAMESVPLKTEAQQRLDSIVPRRPDLAAYVPAGATRFSTARWIVEVDSATGALAYLEDRRSGMVLADADHPLGLLTYESFSAGDYDRYWHQYIRDREFGGVRVWAHPDNTKPGLHVEDHRCWQPSVRAIYQREASQSLQVLIEASLPATSQRIGAPELLYFEYALRTDALSMTLRWFDKPACRLPEAYWLNFNPRVSDDGTWHIHKLGQTIDPRDVVSRGARTLHSFDSGVSYSSPHLQLEIHSLDTALVAPGRPSLLDFQNRLPDMAGGMHFNLYNNVWGTNFPMWFEDDALFRFRLSIDV